MPAIMQHAPQAPLKLSQLFDTVLRPYEGQNVEIGTLINAFDGRGFGVLLILFALPLAIPIPTPPPIDTILGLPLLYLFIQMIMGRNTPHLPKRVLRRRISVDFLLKAFERGRGWLQRLECLFHPRMNCFGDKTALRICGVLGLICTISVLVPFPLSNTVPAIGMMLMGAGLIMQDKLAAFIGGLGGVLWVLMLVMAAIFGASYVFDWLGGLF